MEQLTQVLLNGALSILAILVGVMIDRLRKWVEAKAGLAGVKTVEIIAKNVVNAVEQISKDKDINGKEKFDSAQRMALDILNANGVNVSLAELNAAIESAVKAMNDSWNSTKPFEPSKYITTAQNDN